MNRGEPLGVGVVGLGVRGFWLSHLARVQPGTRLVAVADLRPDMREHAARLFPDAAILENDVELARHPRVEAVVVATGDRYHAANARVALEAGKPVLIEKPLAQSFEDLRAIADLRQQTGLTVGTYLELPFAPLWVQAARIVASGELGTVLAADVLDRVGRDQSQFFARPRTRRREAVSSLVLQKGVHSLDLLNGLMGARPETVSAVGALRHFGGDRPDGLRCRDCPHAEECPHVPGATTTLEPLGLTLPMEDDHCVWAGSCDVEDVSLLTIRYEGGALATYREVHFDPGYGLSITLWGDRARLDITADHDMNEARLCVTQRYSRETREEPLEGGTGHGSADEQLLADFTAAVRGGHDPRQGLAAGYYSAAIAIAARQSMDNGGPVEIPPV